jgi:hypothetical protein
MGEAVISTLRWRRPARAIRIRAQGWARIWAGVLAAFALAAIVAAPARAATTTERSSSILIFPKVVFDGSRDTLIQISNTSNSMVHAHCFYVNAAPLCVGFGDCLAGTCTGTCEPQWVEVDFAIWLTKQQPTHWSVGNGRLPDPAAQQCSPQNSECDAAGLFTVRIPPVSSVPFAGELRCIEVDQSGAPISGNHLKGEATIVSTDGDASKYNAVGIQGEPFTNDGDDVLCIGGAASDECPSGAEYEGCGDRLFVDQFAEGADDPLLGPTSQVRTELTLVPCRADFERQIPSKVVVQMLAFNEFESRFSASTTVDCWRSFFLGDVNSIFNIRTMQTRFVETQLRVSDQANSGIVGISEEYHRLNGAQSRVAFNLHEQGTRQKTDVIYLPEGP